MSNDTFKFNNHVTFRSFGADGKLLTYGELYNVTAAPLKDLVAKLFTGGTTIPSLFGLHWRLDGLTDLGTFDTYILTTCYSTRYNSATRINSIGLSGTYTATANVSLKVAAITENTTYGSTVAVGDTGYFYSTNFNMACGSAGKLVIDWSVNF